MYKIIGVAGENYNKLTPEEQAQVQAAGDSAKERYVGGRTNLSGQDAYAAEQVGFEAAQRSAESIFTSKSNQIQASEEKRAADTNAFIAQNPNAPLPSNLDPGGQYVTSNGVLTTKSAIAEQQANEAAVANGTMRAVPIGEGTGYVPVGSPADAALKNPASISTSGSPTLPQPTASQTNQTYTESLNSDVATKSKALDDAYKREIDNLNKQQADTQKQIDQYTKQQEGVLGEVDKLTQPFRADLEKSERERLKVEENYFANQKLIGELETLLNEGNALIASQQNATGLSAIRNPRIAKTMSDIAARAGVIEAVLSARSGQIAEAYRLIDRSIEATTADRQDRLNYYQTLYNFYEGQKDVAGKKLVTLEADERRYLDAQIGKLENELASAQATADYLKQQMVSPETAYIYAQAGVTLNDSIPTINAKLAKFTKDEQTRAEQQTNRDEAFAGGIKTQFYNKQGTIIRTADGKAYSTPQAFFADAGVTSFEEAYARGLISEMKTGDGKLLEVSPGATLFDPATGQPVYAAPTAKSGGGGGGSAGGGGSLPSYADPDYTMTSIQNSAGGRFLTQSELKPITDIQTVVGQAEVLTNLINEVDTGPILGIIRSNNPYDTKAQLMKAAITAVIPKLARGVYGEVGVLTDNDIALYSRTIANLTSTNDVNKAVMMMTLDIATRSLANQLNSLAAGGRDVSKFAPIYKGMVDKTNGLKSQLGSVPAPGDSNFTGPVNPSAQPTQKQPEQKFWGKVTNWLFGG